MEETVSIQYVVGCTEIQSDYCIVLAFLPQCVISGYCNIIGYAFLHTWSSSEYDV